MAKKVVATLKTGTGKQFTKCIKMVADGRCFCTDGLRRGGRWMPAVAGTSGRAGGGFRRVRDGGAGGVRSAGRVS